MVAGKPADQRWWSEDQTCCLACASMPFWHLLRVPSPSRTLSWLDMPAPSTCSWKRSVRLGRKRLGRNPCRCHAQSLWERSGILISDLATVESSLVSCEQQASFLAAAAPHSGDWLYALPITSCGFRLDDESVRVAVGLRLGRNVCVSHACVCGTQVDACGSHAFVCKRAPGRIARHQAMNDVVVARAFASAGVPVTKEPVALARQDGKRPDGLTLIPCKRGKPLTWDVTVAHTLADSMRV